MGRTIIVNVTKKDIKTWTDIVNSRHYNKSMVVCEICAVAQAIKRHTCLIPVKVYCNSVLLGKKSIATPFSLYRDKISLIDNGKIVTPFKFKLELPDGL